MRIELRVRSPDIWQLFNGNEIKAPKNQMRKQTKTRGEQIGCLPSLRDDDLQSVSSHGALLLASLVCTR